jgi:AcrR family transcriptional regulator
VKRATVEQRRTEILETTYQVVVERGFAATRVSDVASRLGVSTGLIHYHFDSKELLLAEALRYAAEQDIARLEQELDQAHTALAKLDTMFTFDMPEVGEPSWMLWIDGWGEALRNPTMRRISQRLDVAWKDRLVSIIELGVEDGEFTCPDPQATAWRLSALLDGLGVQFTVHEGVLSRLQLLGYMRAAAAQELGIAESAFKRLHRRKVATPA